MSNLWYKQLTAVKDSMNAHISHIATIVKIILSELSVDRADLGLFKENLRKIVGDQEMVEKW